MVQLFILCGENAEAAREQFLMLFPRVQPIPSPNTIRAAARHFYETGNVIPTYCNAGRPPRSVRNPRTSTRKVGQELRISHVLVHKVLRDDKVHPYHFQKVQQLLPRDFVVRREFCTKFIVDATANPVFPCRIFYTDECIFTNDGILNLHNYRHYIEENPHLVWENKSQYKFKLNVWAGLVDGELVRYLSISFPVYTAT